MTSNPRVLAAQRKMTAALIADDPTPAALIPVTRTTTPSGGYADTEGAPRASQTFKLSVLAYDQRPAVTVAGVERLADFHLIGPYNMAIEVGDHWTDANGTSFEVVELTEGWEWMVKAVVIRRVPREANP